MSDEGNARWERTYSEEGRRWGDEPSELARLAVARLRLWRPEGEVDDAGHLRILDVGCGYGRDSVFMTRELGAAVVGIDPAARAIELAGETAPPGLALDYRCGTITEVADGPFEAVFSANTYHVLRPPARRAFAQRSAELLRSGGLLFLSTLDAGDPEHSGRGRPVPGDDGSRLEGDTYLHFSSPESLRAEFGAFSIEWLEAHAFREAHADGSGHEHLHLLLVARQP